MLKKGPASQHGGGSAIDNQKQTLRRPQGTEVIMTSMTSGGSSSTVADLKPFFYGGIASCVAEAVTFPIDTAKTRLQLQGNSLGVPLKVHS